VNWFLQSTRRRGGPLHVFVTQNGDWMCQARNMEYRSFRCDGLVCVNPTYYERHRERYRAILIPNGVDPNIFYPGSDQKAEIFEEPRLPHGQPIVLMVSALSPSKRIAEGISAVAKVPNAFLVVAGDGPERKAVAELARQLLPDRHLFLGSIPRERMPSLYRRANAFLHMSQDEPCANAYFEAACTGLPCVLHDGTVQRWIVGDAGMYSDTNDLAAVAESLKQALRNKERGTRAREHVLRNWTWQALTTKYRTFLHELLASKSQSSKIRGMPK
jgi:glycosyltransferase involved in cell wall biosynthesis